MSKMRYLVAICMVCLLTFCSASKKMSYGMKRFTYEYDGMSYKIFSYTHEDKLGYNLLVSNDKAPHILKARDLNQDGTIDTVLSGSMTLIQADRIYQAGLNDAQLSGNLENRKIMRKYETEDQNHQYLIQTYLPLMGDVYNKFTVIEKKPFGKTYILKDWLADGSLDIMEVGIGKTSVFQPMYDMVLQNGIDENRLERKEASYYVSLK